MQHRIAKSGPLLDSLGILREPGWDTKLSLAYRKKDVKAPAIRRKEWDYYLITNGKYGLALTIADNGYMGLVSISLLDFQERWEQTTSPMLVMPMGKLKLPETMEYPNISASASEDFAFVAEQVPSTFMYLSSGYMDERGAYSAHNPKVQFNEEVLPRGAAYLAHCAQRWLEEHA